MGCKKLTMSEYAEILKFKEEKKKKMALKQRQKMRAVKDSHKMFKKTVEAYSTKRAKKIILTTEQDIIEYRLKKKQRGDAYAAIAKALRSGVLVMQPCIICGDTVSTHGHHEDYSKPLDVVWYCSSHHTDRHKQLGWGGPYGSRPGRSLSAQRKQNASRG